jgi:hypothetical protein
VGMYRKVMSTHIADGDSCNHCRCDDRPGHKKGKQRCILCRPYFTNYTRGQGPTAEGGRSMHYEGAAHGNAGIRTLGKG